MLRSKKFKPTYRVSHADGDIQINSDSPWWSQGLQIIGGTLNSWFINKGKEIETEGKVAEANAQNNMSTLLAQLKSKESENSTKTAYVIGGSIVAVVLVIVVAMMFKK